MRCERRQQNARLWRVESSEGLGGGGGRNAGERGIGGGMGSRGGREGGGGVLDAWFVFGGGGGWSGGL